MHHWLVCVCIYIVFHVVMITACATINDTTCLIFYIFCLLKWKKQIAIHCRFKSLILNGMCFILWSHVTRTSPTAEIYVHEDPWCSMIHDVPCGVRAFELASKMLKPTIGRQKNKKTVRVDGKKQSSTNRCPSKFTTYRWWSWLAFTPPCHVNHTCGKLPTKNAREFDLQLKMFKIDNRGTPLADGVSKNAQNCTKSSVCTLKSEIRPPRYPLQHLCACLWLY